MIDWKPIAEMPDELRDGREVLVWTTCHMPWLASCWSGNWNDSTDAEIKLTPTHYCEITPPRRLSVMIGG